MKVLVTGTFDGFHPGHLHYFEQAKKEGNYLIVVVARDSTVRKEKGKLPRIKESDRLKLVKNIKIVDEAILGDEKDKLKSVEKIKPDIICLGYDQQVDEHNLQKELEKRKLHVMIKRMQPYNKEYKSKNLF